MTENNSLIPGENSEASESLSLALPFEGLDKLSYYNNTATGVFVKLDGYTVEDKIKAIIAAETRKSLLKKKTDPAYIKRLPIGKGTENYVPHQYMDNEFKEMHPLYDCEIVGQPIFTLGWVTVSVRLTDKRTGNSNPGIGSARIMLKRDGEPTPDSILNLGHNVKSALSHAIKNAESRFGVAADIYGKDIVSSEDLAIAEAEFNAIVKKYIRSPLENNEARREFTELDPAGKLNYVEALRNKFEPTT